MLKNQRVKHYDFAECKTFCLCSTTPPCAELAIAASPLAEYAEGCAEYVILACGFSAHRERQHHIEDAHQR